MDDDATDNVPVVQPVPDIVSDALMFNAFLGDWNPAAAVSYAKADCGSGPGLCAEFAIRAIAAGGAVNPFITWAPTLQLVRALFSFTTASALRVMLRLSLCSATICRSRRDVFA
jgi:hypothetical protein